MLTCHNKDSLPLWPAGLFCWQVYRDSGATFVQGLVVCQARILQGLTMSLATVLALKVCPLFLWPWRGGGGGPAGGPPPQAWTGC